MISSPWTDTQRVLRSFRFAIDGIAMMLRTQPNARVHAVLGVAAGSLALWLGVPLLEMAVLIVAMGLVLVAEAVNTAVESTVDLASPDLHPLARQAKDVAAGAVLLSALTAVIVGLLLLGPRLLARMLGSGL